MKEYKIVYDGTPAGTKIFDPDGNLLQNAIGCTIHMNTNEILAVIDVLALKPHIEIDIPEENVIIRTEEISNEAEEQDDQR
jgi:hypothetical protein